MWLGRGEDCIYLRTAMSRLGGKRSVGRQRRSWVDCVSSNLSTLRVEEN